MGQLIFCVFVKHKALLPYQILFTIFDTNALEKFTFKFFIFTFEKFEFSINHTSIPCVIPEISYRELPPKVLINLKKFEEIQFEENSNLKKYLNLNENFIESVFCASVEFG